MTSSTSSIKSMVPPSNRLLIHNNVLVSSIATNRINSRSYTDSAMGYSSHQRKFDMGLFGHVQLAFHCSHTCFGRPAHDTELYTGRALPHAPDRQHEAHWCSARGVLHRPSPVLHAYLISIPGAGHTRTRHRAVHGKGSAPRSRPPAHWCSARGVLHRPSPVLHAYLISIPGAGHTRTRHRAVHGKGSAPRSRPPARGTLVQRSWRVAQTQPGFTCLSNIDTRRGAHPHTTQSCTREGLCPTLPTASTRHTGAALVACCTDPARFYMPI